MPYVVSGLVLGGIVAGGYLLGGRRLDHPVLLFGLVWLTASSLHALQLSELQDPMPMAVATILIVSALAFTFGYAVVATGERLWAEAPMGPEPSVGAPTMRRDLIVAAFAAWLAITALEIVVSGGLPLVWLLTGDARTYFDFGIPTLHGLANCLLLTLMLFAYHYLLTVDGRDRAMWAVLAVGFAATIFFVTRQVFISAVIEMVVLRTLLGRIPRLRWLVLGTVAFVLFFGVMGNLRSGATEFLRVAVLQTTLPAWTLGVMWIYVYVTMSITNLANMVAMGFEPLGGAATATEFLPSFLTGGVTDVEYHRWYYLRSESFNVSGFFAEAYLDWGLAGVAMISAVYGGIGGLLYRRARARASLGALLSYAAYVQILVLSFFFNLLFYLPTGFQLVMIWFFTRRHVLAIAPESTAAGRPLEAGAAT